MSTLHDDTPRSAMTTSGRAWARRCRSSGWRRTRLAAAGCAALLVATSGCTVIGPAGLQGGRGAYAAAIARTNEEQALEAIVRLRYADAPSLLTVASVTANMKFTGKGGFEAGVGPADTFSGNLVPLSGSVAYEENPTISYVPLDGARYVRRMLTPIPLDLLLLLLDVHRAEGVAYMLIDRVNSIRNPAFAQNVAKSATRKDETAGHDNEARFDRLVALLGELDAAGCINWGRQFGVDNDISLSFHSYAPTHVAPMLEMLQLLGITPREDNGVLTVPIYLGVGGARPSGIALQTRSVQDLLFMASANIDVPEEHVENGLALPVPKSTTSGRFIRIRSSKRPPATATVAIEHRGWWFYVDRADVSSREAFQLLQILMTERLSDVSGASRAPVFTVPVSQ